MNVVPGLGETAGAALVRHPGVDKLSFTGSPEVGREIAVQAARDFKKVTLELGGKSPQIVLGDANLEAVIPGLAQGFFGNQGEICAAGTRILVQRELYDDVVAGPRRGRQARCSSATRSTRAPRWARSSTPSSASASPATSRRAPRRARRSSRAAARPDRKGFFVEPTVFAGGGNDLTIAQEEIFGPVGLVLPVRRAGGGDRDGQRHALRPRRLHLDDEPLRGPPLRRRGQGRRRVDQRRRAARPAPALGRREDERRRPRARLGGHRGPHRREDGDHRRF